MRKAILSGEHYMSGDIASAEGALAAGCRFFGGYPITPSSELAERMSRRLPEVGGIFFQGEDELCSIATILGASWGGKKAMTATSGPGFSLMMENYGLGIMTETPCVIVNVQRGSPSTGLPTLTGQGDVMQSRWGSHGPYESIAICPNSVQECFDMTVRAFNLSEEYRHPVIVLMDEAVGHMFEKVVIPKRVETIERKRPKSKAQLPYEPDEDMIPPMAEVGKGYRIHSTGLTHDEHGYPAMTAEAHEKLLTRLCDKISKNEERMRDYEEYRLNDADIAVISYGTPSRSVKRAISCLREEGIKAGMLRLKTIWPFPGELIEKIAKDVDIFVVVEVNNGQIRNEVQRFSGTKPVKLIGKMGGATHRPEEVVKGIKEVA